MEHKNIRILLDLSELKDRLHKYIWMHISTLDLRNIADFKDAVIKKLSLSRNDINMFINGGLLLEEENIIVLRENDTVKIQYSNLSNKVCHSSSCVDAHDNRTSNMEKNEDDGKSSKKWKSEVITLTIPDDSESRNSRKCKRKRNLVASDTLQQYSDWNITQGECDVTVYEVNENSIYNEKKKKRKKSLGGSSAKNAFVHIKSNTNDEACKIPSRMDAVTIDDSSQENSTVCDINAESIYFQKKKKPKKSCTSTAKDAFIQIGDNNGSTIPTSADADITIDDSSQENKVCDIKEHAIYYEKKKKPKKSHTNSSTKDALIHNEKEITTIPLNVDADITIDDSSQENKVCDIKEHCIYYEKKKKPKKSHTNSSTKDALIHNEKEITTIPLNVDADITIDDSSQENNQVCEERIHYEKQKKHKTFCSTSAVKGAFIVTESNNAEITTIPVNVDAHITIDDSSQESTKVDNGDNNPSVVTIEPFVQSNNCKKKRRKRSRKRRVEQNLVTPFMPKTIETSPKPLTDNFPSFSSYDNFSGVRKHIRFTSPTPKIDVDVVDLETHCPQNKSESLPKTSPKDTYTSSFTRTLPSNSDKIYENNTHSVTNKADTKISTPTLQISFEHNSWSVSPMQNRNVDKSSPRNTVSTSNAAFSYTDYPSLNALPLVGSCIAFKLLELNESYSPEVSSYKEGVIKSINPNSDEIEIELSEVEVKAGRIGKFENLDEGELPTGELIKKVTTSWASLIEPRLILRG